MAVNGNVEVGGLSYTTAVGNLFVSGTITTSGSLNLGTAIVDASSDLVLSSSLNSIVAISGALEFPTNERRHVFANNSDLILSSSTGNTVVSGNFLAGTTFSRFAFNTASLSNTTFLIKSSGSTSSTSAFDIYSATNVLLFHLADNGSGYQQGQFGVNTGGSATSPGITVLNNNSGFFVPGTSQLGFATAGKMAGYADANQNWYFSGGLTIGTGSFSSSITFGTGTKVSSSADGVLQITSNAGLFGALLLGGTSQNTGILLSASAGALNLSTAGNGISLTGLSQITVNGAGIFNNSNSNGAVLGLGASAASTYVVYTGTSNVHTVTNNTGIAGQPGFINQGTHTVSKTSAYTIVGKDTGVTFNTNGAVATVPFTILSSTLGLTYRFQATAAQVLSVTSVSGSIFAPGSLTGNTRIVSGTVGANQFTSFEVVCYDGLNYMVQRLQGTIQ